MAEYTKRTCHKCGKRDIQPHMKQIEIEYTSGSSKSGVSGATVVGAVLGHKASERAIGRTIFNSSKRNYKRRKKVWVCKRGCDSSMTSDDHTITEKIFGFIIFAVIVIGILGLFSN